jgi:hypothetical protein
MRQYVFFVGLGFLFFGFAPVSANAADSLIVSEVWARATPPSAEVGAAYFTLENLAGTPDTLIAVASPVASRTEMHTHSMQDGMMMMMQLESVEVPAGGVVEFKPGGNHIMFIGLERPLVEGERFPMTLQFEHAGLVELIVEVRGIGG